MRKRTAVAIAIGLAALTSVHASAQLGKTYDVPPGRDFQHIRFESAGSSNTIHSLIVYGDGTAHFATRRPGRSDDQEKVHKVGYLSYSELRSLLEPVAKAGILEKAPNNDDLKARREAILQGWHLADAAYTGFEISFTDRKDGHHSTVELGMMGLLGLDKHEGLAEDPVLAPLHETASRLVRLAGELRKSGADAQ